jgi:hypothetical protein
MLSLKTFKKFGISVAAVAGIMLVGYGAANATGPDVHTIQTTLGHSTRTVMRMIMLVAAIAGIAFVAMGLFSFKAASDSAGQQNNNLQKGMVKLVIGGALISLPFLLTVSQNSTMTSGMSDTGISVPVEASAYSGQGHSNV